MPKKTNNKTPAKAGDLFEITIDNLASGGDGVGRTAEGYTVFVPFSAPGDRVRVRVTQARKTFARAAVAQVLQPGPGRVEPPCPVAGQCGGCSWLHLNADAQAQAKTNMVRQAFARIGGLKDVPVADIVRAEPALGYRNRCQVPVRAAVDGSLRMGFFAAGSHTVVPLPASGCAVQSAAMNMVLRFVRGKLQAEAWPPYDEKKNAGLLRHLVLRDNAYGEVMLVLVTTTELNEIQRGQAEAWVDQCGPLVSVVSHVQPGTGNTVLGGVSAPLAGPDYLVEEMAGLHFRQSAESFFQVNRGQTPQLWDKLKRARDWKGSENVVELYCGVGTLSLFLAGLCGKLWGFESAAGAVRDALANARRNNAANAAFFNLPSEKAFEKMAELDAAADVVVLDPPRKGMSAAVLAALLTHRPAEILYVSCDPASLSRDLGALSADGYNVEGAWPVDLFPQTWHVETVAHLKLKAGHLD